MIEAFRYGLGTVAFAWLLWQVEFDRLARLLASVDLATGAALLAVTALGLLARFATWYVVIDRVEPASLLTAADTDLVVNFVNQLLPSRVTGRAAAPLVLRTTTGMDYAAAVAVAGVHTGLYAVLYAAGAAAGLAFGFGQLPPGLVLLLGLSAGLYLAAGVVVLLAGTNLGYVDRVVASVRTVLRRLPAVGERLAGATDAVPAFTDRSTAWFRRLTADPRVLLPFAAAWTGVMVLAPGLRVWLLLESFGASFEPAVLIPLYLLSAYSVTLLPLTPGGIGVSEATATAVFAALGVPPAVFVPVVFVDRLLGTYLPALAGWYSSLRIDVSGLLAE